MKWEALALIAEELAEANRLKRLEIRANAIAAGALGIVSHILTDLEKPA